MLCPVLPKRHLLRERQRLPRPVQANQLQAFFHVIDRAIQSGVPEAMRDRAMFILMLRCGLRIGEAANLLLTNLYLDEPRPRMVVNGKGSRERLVYLSPQAERALRRYLAIRQDPGQLFEWSRRDVELDRLGQRLRRLQHSYCQPEAITDHWTLTLARPEIWNSD